MRKVTLVFLAISALCGFVTAQGTRCSVVSADYVGSRCKRPGQKNTPPAVTLKVAEDDDRSLELCLKKMLSEQDCGTLLGHIRLLATASDPDGDQLLYTYSSTAGRITAAGDVAGWNLKDVDAGFHVVSVEVDDGCGCIAFAGASLNLKPLAPSWLDGTWKGTGYQFGDTDASWDIVMTAANGTYSVDYPGLNCGGEWQLLYGLGDVARFRERITLNDEICTQSGFMRVARLPSGDLGFTYTALNGKSVTAAGILKSQPKKPVPTKPKKPIKRTR